MFWWKLLHMSCFWWKLLHVSCFG